MKAEAHSTTVTSAAASTSAPCFFGAPVSVRIPGSPDAAADILRSWQWRPTSGELPQRHDPHLFGQGADRCPLELYGWTNKLCLKER
ncbi:hypothetical protein GCM10009587_32560 [Microbacterium maritypicum]